MYEPVLTMINCNEPHFYTSFLCERLPNHTFSHGFFLAPMSPFQMCMRHFRIIFCHLKLIHLLLNLYFFLKYNLFYNRHYTNTFWLSSKILPIHPDTNSHCSITLPVHKTHAFFFWLCPHHEPWRLIIHQSVKYFFETYPPLSTARFRDIILFILIKLPTQFLLHSNLSLIHILIFLNYSFQPQFLQQTSHFHNT